MTPRRVRVAVSLAIAAVLLWLLARWGELAPADLWAAVRSLPLSTFALALAIHVAIYALRAWRFRVLIPSDPRPSFGQAFAVGAAHNLATYVLPAKTGEASWVVYLRAQAGVPASVGLASLLLARLLDLGVLCAGLGASCLALAASGRYERLAWLPRAGLVLLLLSALVLAVAARGPIVADAPARGLRRLGAERWRAGRAALERLGRVSEALRAAGGARRLGLAALLTAPQWLLIFAFHAVLGLSMGLPAEVGFAGACFGASLAVITNLLPINGLAGFGTQEVGWVAGFAALGVARDAALASGIGVHLVQLFDTVLLGVIGHAAMGVRSPLPDDGGVRR